MRHRTAAVMVFSAIVEALIYVVRCCRRSIYIAELLKVFEPKTDTVTSNKGPFYAQLCDRRRACGPAVKSIWRDAIRPGALTRTCCERCEK